MKNTSTLQVEPLAPSWIQALLPLIKDALLSTAGRKSAVEVTITFNAQEPDVAHWSQVTEQKFRINLQSRLVEATARSLFSAEPPDVSVRRAIALIAEKGGKLRDDLKRQPFGCRQLVLVIKEGRLTGLKSLESVPLRNQKR